MPRDDRPNILLIMSDQHSKHVVGAYGNDIVRTPNVDRLSAEGMRFTGAYCAAPLCVPSRMSFLTARTPSRNRVWDNGHILSQSMPTWAHYLSIAGYRTSLIGRMHFRGTDQRHGFEERPIGEFWTDHPGVGGLGTPSWGADHGDMAGEHGCWWKSNYYEGSAGVPLIARLPGTVPAGAQSDAVCNLVDIGPTFVELAGGEPMRDVDGRSMWPLMRGQPQPEWPNETFSEFVEVKYTGDTNYPSRMIRSGPWKLWHYADEAGLPPALFNLDEDPDELQNLGRDPEHAGVRDRLLAKLHEGWDPQRVQRDALEASRRMPVLKEWGRCVSPECPDALGFPPEGLEDEIEVL